MKKLRFTAVILLILMGLQVLCACGKESDSSDEVETKEPEKIRFEIQDAYGLDDNGKELVADMFEKFDEALQKLQKKTSVSDEDFNEYVRAVTDAFTSFDEGFGIYKNKLMEKVKNGEKAYGTVDSKYFIISRKINNLSLDLINGRGGEGLFENAINDCVNDLSNFFYGKDRITDKDLNALALE